MTIVDTSVLIAILKREGDADDWIDTLRTRRHLHLPASCYLEAAMVLSRLRDGRGGLDALIIEYEIDILACDAAQARLAADAFERYGRGSGHPARLNFGDCLAYAAARAKNAPLLYKGGDFTQTDVALAA